MFSHNGLVKVLWVKAYAKCTIRLAGVCQGQYPLIRLGDRSHNTFGDHVIEGVLILILVVCGYFPSGVLDRGMEGYRICCL